MKITYTRKEVDAASTIVQQVIVAVGGLPLADKSIEEQIELSNGLMYFADNGDVVFEVPEEVVLQIFAVYGKHMPTIVGIVVTLKGISMTFKAMAKSLTKELDQVSQSFLEGLVAKKKAAVAAEEAAKTSVDTKTEA